MYRESERGTKRSDCLPCPENTYNVLTGQKACRMCGSSAFSLIGATKCTCRGKHRAFQVSDGSCVCEAGYIFFNEADLKEDEANSDKDCQPMVGELVVLQCFVTI